MSSHRVVVDGSNIATEGRSLPSLVQLDEAVRAYRDEHPDAEIIVVVDATFAHRIDESERAMFEEAAAHNELVYPPAGAIGRGDAFLLRIADKTDAVVLSNDSFQEFHGEFEWLFTKGRLIGGTPVPGVGWIFVPRTPVRGPKSREAVKEAKRGKARIGSKDASQPMPVPKAPPPRSPKNKDAKGGDSSGPPKGQGKGGRLKDAIDEATEEAVTGELAGADDSGGEGGKSGRKRRRRKGKGGSAPATLPTVNEPLTFIQFIADHQPGATVEGEIESFASHGAFVLVGDARCYIPLSAMGDPPPRSAREVLNRGETRTFVVQALDAPRRGIELALPGFEHVAGGPTDETVEAEIGEAPPPIHVEATDAEVEAAAGGRGRGRRGGRARGAASPETDAPPTLDGVSPDADDAPAPVKKAAGRRAATKKAAAAEVAEVVDAVEPAAPAEPVGKAPARKRAAAKKAATPEPGAGAPDPLEPATASAVKKVAATKKATAAKKTAAKKAPAGADAAPVDDLAPAKKAAAKKVPAAKKAPTKKAAAATSTSASDEAAPAKKAAAKKAPAAEKVPAAKKVAAEKATAAKKSPAKNAAAKKAPAKKAAAKKAPAKRAATKKAPPAG